MVVKFLVKEGSNPIEIHQWLSGVLEEQIEERSLVYEGGKHFREQIGFTDDEVNLEDLQFVQRPGK